MSGQPETPSTAKPDQILELFENGWLRTGRPPALHAFMPPSSALAGQARRELLHELIKIDLECRWRASPRLAHESWILENYSQAFQELGPVEDLPADLIMEEYRVRARWAKPPQREDFLARFATRRDELEPLLAVVDAELEAESGDSSMTLASGVSSGPTVASGASEGHLASWSDVTVLGSAAPLWPSDPKKRPEYLPQERPGVEKSPTAGQPGPATGKTAPGQPPSAKPPTSFTEQEQPQSKPPQPVSEAQGPSPTPQPGKQVDQQRSAGPEAAGLPGNNPPAAGGPSAQPGSGQSQPPGTGPANELTAVFGDRRYLPLMQLGSGTFGSVYLARDGLLDRLVAVKVPHRRITSRSRGKDDRGPGLHEARMAARLQHPNVVTIYDVIPQEEGSVVIVMEYVDGQTLRQILNKRKPSPVWCATVMAQVAYAVQAAHEMDMVHRDLKPANLLIDERGVAYVADFGLALLTQQKQGHGRRLVGTPAYMSPEQVRGDRHVDARSDLWSLGVILYEMLAGRLPFSGKSRDELFANILKGPLPNPVELREVPEDLADICLGCLAPLEDRLSSARRLALALEGWLARESEPAPGGNELGSLLGAARSASTGRTPGDFAGPAAEAGRPASSQGGSLEFRGSQSSLVGRESLLAELNELVSPAGSWLVTLTGPTGIGKTRVATHFAWGLQQQAAENPSQAKFPGGIYFADLSEATDATQLATVVAETLSMQVGDPQRSSRQLAEQLATREPTLLVLDNFEHLVSLAENTLGLWGCQAPQVRFLVTSQTALRLAGERVLEVQPLTAPPLASVGANARAAEGSSILGPAGTQPAGTKPGAARPGGARRSGLEDSGAGVGQSQAAFKEDPLAFESVRLFCDRAREVNPDFGVDSSNRSEICAICAVLEGIPLAVELAAARVQVLTPAQILHKLSEPLSLLKSSRRDLRPRQRTLLGAITWSFELLSEVEKDVFLQTCFFESGFELDDAEAIIEVFSPLAESSLSVEAQTVLDVLEQLRERSFLRSTKTRFGPRFCAYQTLRRFGEARIRETWSVDRRQALSLRFATHFAARAEHWASKYHGPRALEAIDRLELECDNLLAAVDWSVQAGSGDLAARMVLALAPTLLSRGHLDQLLEALNQTLAVVGEPESAQQAAWRGQLLTAASEASRQLGQADKAEHLAQTAVSWARERGLSRELADALRQQALLRMLRGDLPAAEAAYRESESLSQGISDRTGLTASLIGLGRLALQQGQLEPAWDRFRDAMMLAHDLRDEQAVAEIARHQGRICWQRREYEAALRYYTQTQAIARKFGDLTALCTAVGSRGTILADQGNYQAALRCYTEAESLARNLGDRRRVATNLSNRGLALTDLGQYPEALGCFEQAEKINRELHSTAGVALNIGNAGRVHAAMGHIDQALQLIGQARQMHLALGNEFMVGINDGDEGEALLRAGRLIEASEILTRALERLSKTGAGQSLDALGFVLLLAEAQWRRGGVEAARSTADHARELVSVLQLSEDHPKLQVCGQPISLGRWFGPPPQEHAD